MNIFYLTTDINLQKGVLLFAIFALIFALLVIAFNAYQSVGGISQSWPPAVSKCPDYWELSSDGNTCTSMHKRNMGTLLNSTLPVNNFGKTNQNRTKWATKNGIVWDGLTSDSAQ